MINILFTLIKLWNQMKTLYTSGDKKASRSTKNWILKIMKVSRFSGLLEYSFVYEKTSNIVLKEMNEK